MENVQQGLILLCDSSSGVYIPKRFAEEIDRQYVKNIDHDLFDDISSPDDELYWEAWVRFLDNAQLQIGNNTYLLHHDGDLWAYCPDLMSEEELNNLFDEYYI